jgi:hypothetical protein
MNECVNLGPFETGEGRFELKTSWLNLVYHLVDSSDYRTWASAKVEARETLFYRRFLCCHNVHVQLLPLLLLVLSCFCHGLCCSSVALCPGILRLISL